jgi:hypothetical protein
MNEADFDERDRERNAEISRHYRNALVRELREVYGRRFAAGHADTSTLREVISRLDRTSLSELHRDHATGRLHAKATQQPRFGAAVVFKPNASTSNQSALGTGTSAPKRWPLFPINPFQLQ